MLWHGESEPVVTRCGDDQFVKVGREHKNVLNFNKGKYIVYQDGRGSTLRMIRLKMWSLCCWESENKYFDNFEIPEWCHLHWLNPLRYQCSVSPAPLMHRQVKFCHMFLVSGNSSEIFSINMYNFSKMLLF